MSVDGVYPSKFLFSFLGMSSSKRPEPDSILGVEVARCSIGVVRGVVQVIQIGLQEFRILPEVRG